MLELEVDEPENPAPPSIFSNRSSKKSSKLHSLALPPIEGLEEMWDYRFRKASAKDSRGETDGDSLHAGQFLHYLKPNMKYYTTVPQKFSLLAPRVPENFYNIAKISTQPSTLTVPTKQYIQQESVIREDIQILHHLGWFKRAVVEINTRIQSLSKDIISSEDQEDIQESAELIAKYASLQARILQSIEKALDTLCEQNLTMACNLALNRRDNLLQSTKPNIALEDISGLRTSSFTGKDLFPSASVSNVENNFIKAPSSSQATRSTETQGELQKF